MTHDDENTLELDEENDPQLNGILEEIEANPNRFVDKDHAHGFVIALERHFKRIHERLEQSGIVPLHPEDTIENRVNRALNELDRLTCTIEHDELNTEPPTGHDSVEGYRAATGTN